MAYTLPNGVSRLTHGIQSPKKVAICQLNLVWLQPDFEELPGFVGSSAKLARGFRILS